MKVVSILPLFNATTQWLNRAPNPRETKGHPTIVHFWSIGSETSKVNLSHVADLRDQRKREGLRVIAVHIPRGEAGMDTQAVRDALTRLNVTEPCAADGAHKLCEAFANEQGVVPAYYLFDIEGRLSSSSTGDRGLDLLEDSLDQMLDDLRVRHPFCPACELFLDEEALFCSECGLPLILPGSPHPYYEKHHYASLPTIRLTDPDPLIGHTIDGKYELTAISISPNS
jgi:hypothetical protein